MTDSAGCDTKFAGQRILITGASGFIGSHLRRRLCTAGADVYAISRTPRSECQDTTRWSVGDPADIGTLQQFFDSTKPEIVFHLASHVSGGSRDLTLVLPTFYGNLASTVNLLTLTAERGCRRIVIAGSMEEPTSHQSDPIPSSPYAAAKWSSSSYARMFHRLYKTPVVIARMFSTYGPGQRDTRTLIPHVILSLLQGNAPQLTSGRRYVDWIYVNDVVDGLLASGCQVGVDGCTVDLGSGSPATVHMVVKNLVRLVGSSIEPLFGALPDRPAEQECKANTEDAYAKLGWTPQTTLLDGLKLTVDWYRKNVGTLIDPAEQKQETP